MDYGEFSTVQQHNSVRQSCRRVLAQIGLE